MDRPGDLYTHEYRQQQIGAALETIRRMVGRDYAITVIGRMRKRPNVVIVITGELTQYDRESLAQMVAQSSLQHPSQISTTKGAPHNLPLATTAGEIPKTSPAALLTDEGYRAYCESCGVPVDQVEVNRG